MNKHMTKIKLLSLLSLSVALLVPSLVTARKKNLPGVPPQGQGELPEVVIQGGEKKGVASEKPPLKIDLDPDEPLKPIVAVEEEPLKRQPEFLRNPRAGFADSLNNSNTILPARVRLAKNPVKVFYPLREILAISPSLSQEIGTGWEMVITDTDGRSFRKFYGKGLPPGNLAWNGRSDRGEIASVGKTYSFVISYKDTREQGRNYVGDPFSFDGLIHQESKGLVISLSVRKLYSRSTGYGSAEKIEGDGLELLKEAADWIKRNYFTYPIQIVCYSKDSRRASSRAKTAASMLSKLLLLPRPEIPATGVSTGINEEKLDIIITNR